MHLKEPLIGSLAFFHFGTEQGGASIRCWLACSCEDFGKKAVGAAGGASIATFAQSAKLALAPFVKIIAVWCKEKFV